MRGELYSRIRNLMGGVVYRAQTAKNPHRPTKKRRHILVVEDKLPRAGWYVLVLTVCGCEADSKGEETKEILAREPTQRLRRRIR
jgi:hypothetical protein